MVLYIFDLQNVVLSRTRVIGLFRMKRQTKIFIIISLFTLFTSCEGFKVLTLHNSSPTDANIVVKPGMLPSNSRNVSNHPLNLNLDSSNFVLKPDSSLILLSIFTGMMFNTKIQEQDLRISYMRIKTKTDTIVADSKSAILKLLKSPKMKYKRKVDEKRGITNGRNWGNIFIRE